MITKEEALKVVRRQDLKNKKKTKEAANKVIDRISNGILKGRFTTPNVGNSPEVQKMIKKAFESEGFQVEFFTTPTTNTNKKTRRPSVTYEVTNVRIKLD